jgi:hypothetical protein
MSSTPSKASAAPGAREHGHALLPFLFPWEWTWTKAVLVAVGIVAVLSLWATYKLQTEKEALLGVTELQKVIADKVIEGDQLLRRLKRKKVETVPEELTRQIRSWGERAMRDLYAVAHELGEELEVAHGVGIETRDRQDQINYVTRLLQTLSKFGREFAYGGHA